MSQDWALSLFRKSVLKQEKYRRITEMMDDPTGRRCLDIGADNGVISLLLRRRGGRWASADLDEHTVTSIRELVGEDVHQLEGARSPFPDRTFDQVVVVDYLEHIPDDRTAMAEIARVLRPGGRAVIVVPLDLRRPATHEDPGAASAAQRLAAYGHPYHVRICGADYGERIADAGFAVRRVDSAAALSPHRRRYYRINKTSLFDCRRI